MRLGVVDTHVFYNEHSSPANLRAEILDEQFATITHAHILQERIIIQGFPLTLRREFLTGHIELQQLPQSRITMRESDKLTNFWELGRNSSLQV